MLAQARAWLHKMGRFVAQPWPHFGRWLFALALLQGLIYTALIPPWWNYDEPRHFWRAWILARGPVPDEVYPRLVHSLQAYEWFRVYPKYAQVSLEEYAEALGAMEASGRSTRLYYWYYVTLPLRVIPPEWDLAWQLRVLRGMSVLMFAATVVVAWQAARELFGAAHPLARLVPLSLLLLPGFAEPMSLLNDDVGAAFGGTLFLWAVVRLLRRGLSLRTVAFALAAGWIASQMKRTAVPMLAVLPLALVLAWRPRRWRWLPWAVAAILVVAAGGALLGWGDPAHWYHDRVVSVPLRAPMDRAPDGQWVFRIPPSKIELGQWLPRARYRQMEPTATLRLTFWLWSDRPGKVRLPQLCVSGGGLWKPQEQCTPAEYRVIGPEPQQVVLTLPVLEGSFARLEFFPYTGENVGMVYADAFVLRAAHEPEGTNWLRNGSAEQAGLRLKPLAGKVLPAGSVALPVALAAWQEPAVLVRALRPAVSTLFKTFWGFFARAKVPYLGDEGTYLGLLVLTVLGLAGAARGLYRARGRVLWSAVVVLGGSMLVVWGMAVSFVLGYLHRDSHSLTWFRYAFPAAFPTVTLLVAGWYEWLRARDRAASLLRFMVGLNVLAWWSLALAFYPRWGQLGFLAGLLVLVWRGWPRFVGRWLEPARAVGSVPGPGTPSPSNRGEE